MARARRCSSLPPPGAKGGRVPAPGTLGAVLCGPHCSGARCARSVIQSCPTLCDPVGWSLLGSSVRGFSRQQYWSRLPFPPPEGLPDPGIKLASPVSPESAGGVLSAASLQSFSVAVFICGTWRVSTAKVGLLKWRGLKLAVGRQEGPTDLVLSLAIL